MRTSHPVSEPTVDVGDSVSSGTDLVSDGARWRNEYIVDPSSAVRKSAPDIIGEVV